MHTKNVIMAGKDLQEANKVLVMVHGRGGSNRDIISLSGHLNVKDFALVAPQATNNTWYPYSFMAPPSENEPWLTSALDLLKGVVADLKGNGAKTENIYFMGFSQGACLTLEFVARNATKYGGVVAFTGGLIGDKIYDENYSGNFEGTPIFLGTGNPDSHVPVERVHETARILETMNANVVEKVYENRPHTISQDEIDRANELVFS
jgi:phospholipase/carboxylesterase